MEEITVVQYKADNGAVFETREACVHYETSLELEKHLDSYCDSEYCSDSRQDIRYDSMVVDYLLSHFDQIAEIINKHK